MEIAGYIASVFIGISLGLIGGGGSILTVPVLVYLFSINAVTATAYSLFIVGITSLTGSLSYFKRGLVNLQMAIVFGAPSIIAVYLTRAYLVPAIPEELFSVGEFQVTKRIFLMVLFAVLMLLASFSMIRKKAPTQKAVTKKTINYPLILLEGSIVGVLTGLVGAGGGFLIIPALVLLSNMPMKEAVGTSLLIIAAKSLIGFLGEDRSTPLHWDFLLTVSGFAILGIFIGMALSRRIDGNTLKPAFGWFVLAMGIYIIVKETILMPAL